MAQFREHIRWDHAEALRPSSVLNLLLMGKEMTIHDHIMKKAKEFAKYQFSCMFNKWQHILKNVF